ncbi:hypothetical protein NDU88_004032, partial [Pleurodeles waltl]
EGVQVNPDVLQLNPDVSELYIDLLCQYNPSQVTEILHILEHYRLEETIQITQKHKLHEASAYLLEKKGDVQGAFTVMLK